MAAGSDAPSGLMVGPRPVVRVRVLGGFDVVVRGQALTSAAWQRGSARRLVKLLLVTPGHRMSREVAAETLWPGTTPERGRASLRKAIHFARRALSPDGVILSGNGSVALVEAGIDLDLDRLEEAFSVVAGHAEPNDSGGGPSMAVERAAAVVLRLGGLELLPDDRYEDWLVAPRERLRAGWERVALRAAHASHRAGRREDAHALIDRLLERDPADEAAHRLAIELYVSEGRHEAVRAQIARCRAALRDIGARPGPETLSVFAAGDPSAAARP